MSVLNAESAQESAQHETVASGDAPIRRVSTFALWQQVKEGEISRRPASSLRILCEILSACKESSPHEVFKRQIERGTLHRTRAALELIRRSVLEVEVMLDAAEAGHEQWLRDQLARVETSKPEGAL
jgi:hypothetical protein